MPQTSTRPPGWTLLACYSSGAPRIYQSYNHRNQVEGFDYGALRWCITPAHDVYVKDGRGRIRLFATDTAAMRAADKLANGGQ